MVIMDVGGRRALCHGDTKRLYEDEAVVWASLCEIAPLCDFLKQCMMTQASPRLR